MERHVDEESSGVGGTPTPTFGRHRAPQLMKGKQPRRAAAVVLERPTAASRASRQADLVT
jgi:hypothetical protein